MIAAWSVIFAVADFPKQGFSVESIVKIPVTLKTEFDP